jgi:hypothetical protein
VHPWYQGSLVFPGTQPALRAVSRAAVAPSNSAAAANVRAPKPNFPIPITAPSSIERPLDRSDAIQGWTPRRRFARKYRLDPLIPH